MSETLTVADAVRILGPDCELSEDQIGDLVAQLYQLALFVLDEVGQPANAAGGSLA